MTQLAIQYLGNPFLNFVRALIEGAELSGMARAAAELQRLGYYKEAEQIMQNMRDSV